MKSPKKTDRRVKYTKQAIRDSFLKLLSEKPIEKISVTEICREAEINRGTFYSHYNDPYDLRDSLVEELIEAVRARMQELGVTTRLTSGQMLELLKENQELCRIFAGPYGAKEAMLKIIRTNTAAYMEQESEALCGLSEYMQNCVREMLIASIASVVKCWFDSGMQEPACEISRLLDTFCASGLAGFAPRRLPESYPL